MTKRNITRIQPGDKYGRWTVLKEGPRDKQNKRTALCRCSCEGHTERLVRLSRLRGGWSTGCGCAVRQKPLKTQLHGKTYGRLTVLDEAERSATGKRRWSCECSCGTKTAVHQSHLVTGHTTSCGCYARERVVERNTTHGLSGTREYENALRAANLEKYRASCRKWVKENAEYVTECSARRRAEKLNAIPPWHKEETKTYVKELKKEARRLEKEMGVKYHIDHVVPLSGRANNQRVVCGLHVKDNLQLLTQTENLKKNNRVWPHMPT